jgi:hypothetical protein
MDLEQALEQFDLTEANVARLEKVWAEIQGLVPNGIAFIESTPEGRRYQELTRSFREIAAALPAVSGYRIKSVPMRLNDIAQTRLDAADVGEMSIEIDLDEQMDQPAREIADYRYRFERTRRELVRDQVARLAVEINSYLSGLTAQFPSDMKLVEDGRLDLLRNAFQQIERLAGGQIPRTKAWSDMVRHLRFGQGQDIHGIARIDWPSIQTDLRQNLYTELEPLPVEVADLGDLAKTKPEGAVTTEIRWADLSDEGFERLIFNLISDAEDYENPQWLTETSAPDRGRDLAVEHVRIDSLSGPTRERVVLQCRHWQKRSVGMPQVRVLLDQMKLWEPPAVHVLIIATSGRFTTDAIAWIEKHNAANERPKIDMWANTHLELLLARRPRLSATLHVR